MEAMYKNIANEALEASDVHVISVGGTSFKRYLELARILDIKTAVIRDNDGDPEARCVTNYEDYTSETIKIFFDGDASRSTFEICLYNDNEGVCEELFAEGRRTLSVQDYMLANKADVAFEILSKKPLDISPPTYIKEAVEWIRG
jgi:predicted ATP-dependent endonuclease of OLD family